MTMRLRKNMLDGLGTDAASGIPIDRPEAWSVAELTRLIMVPSITAMVFLTGVYWLRTEHATLAVGGQAAPLFQLHLVIPDDVPVVPPAPQTTLNEGNPSVAVQDSRNSETLENSASNAAPDKALAVDNPQAVSDRDLLSPPSNLFVDQFQKLLQDHVARYQRYPKDAKARRLSGTVDIQFVMSRNGRLRSAWILASSGYAALDREAIATIQRAQPLPAIPAELPEQLTVTLPVAFHSN
jgi:protein TonB